jgi:hypothetical protein
VALRKALLLPLDDLLAVVREFLNPHVSRSGLDRCLRRHEVGSGASRAVARPTQSHRVERCSSTFSRATVRQRDVDPLRHGRTRGPMPMVMVSVRRRSR